MSQTRRTLKLRKKSSRSQIQFAYLSSINTRLCIKWFDKRYRAEAEKRVRFVLAARAIAEAEGITVQPEEVNAEYRRLSVLQDTPEAEIRKVLTEDSVSAALAAKKVQRFLLDHAKVTTVTDPADNAEKE